jgi:hypothetical protein
MKAGVAEESQKARRLQDDDEDKPKVGKERRRM